MFTNLDQFNIDHSLLGSGTYGEVKVGTAVKDKQQYAIKMINSTKLRSPEISAIQREINVHSGLKHPNIIQFISSFETKTQIIIVLELAKKGSLANYLSRQKKLSENEAYYQLLDAIDYLHKKDIIHRDIKPENIVIDKSGTVKLCDFGWCCTGISTKRNTFCGTYEYMSPEIVNKLNYNQNVDIWGLGVLLYEMIFGQTPFNAKTHTEIMNRIKTKEITFPPSTNSNLKNLLQNILNKQLDKRYNIAQIRDSTWFAEQKKITQFNQEFSKLNVQDKENNQNLENKKKSLHKAHMKQQSQGQQFLNKNVFKII